VNYFRAQSYLSSNLATNTTLAYQTFVNAGGINPSQFTLSGSWYLYGASSANRWTTSSYDIYDWPMMASCSACTISGSTLTLAGTINGIFASGQVLLGQGVTGLNSGAGANTMITGCTLGGGNSAPAGGNAADTCSLSQPSTVSSGVIMNGAFVPTDSVNNPIQSWGAICSFNGKNCSWLLNRDLAPSPNGFGGTSDPANDNSPAFMDKAA
jgi:hypothetical protein